MLGMVGGLGPRATVEFYSAFMNTVTGGTEGCLPRLLMYSVAMSPRIENAFLQGRVDDDAPHRLQVRSLLNEAVTHFLKNRVDVAVMPCNTLQDELTALCRQQGLGNINMIDETADAIVRADSRRVLILGTASTYCDDLYGRRLTARGVECVYPTAAEQEFVETYIRLALDCKVDSAVQDRFAGQVSQMARDTDGVVLACTDLSNDVSPALCGKPVFDSLQILAKASAEYVMARDELFV